MVNSIPQEIKEFCQAHVGEVKSFTPASGGCINNGGAVAGNEGELFIKWNSASRFPNMFTTEAKGLEILARPGCIVVPKVISVYEGVHYSGILMEIISPGRRSKDYWEQLAQSMADLHRVTRKQFGLDHQNYIGSLPQYNKNNPDWIDFFISQRLEPQIKMATDAGKLTAGDIGKFRALERILPAILVDAKPSLIHGDLWSGNLMIDSHGSPAIIDPAVSFSNREMEMAFTQLFGGFDRIFYERYNDIFPLETGYQKRFDVYNIYPLLVHVNLFGGGYYYQVMQIVSRLI